MLIVLQQIAADVAGMSPNRSGRGSYILLDATERSRLTLNWLKSTDFIGVFPEVVISNDTWEKQFDVWFPEPGSELFNKLKRQNFSQSRFYTAYRELVTNVTKRSHQTVLRNAIRKEFNKLHWIPHATASRMWDTHLRANAKRYPAPEPGKAPGQAVIIVLNPKTHGRVQAGIGGNRQEQGVDEMEVDELREEDDDEDDQMQD